MQFKYKHSRSQIHGCVEVLRDNVYTRVGTLDAVAYTTTEPVAFAERESGTRIECAEGGKWGGLFDCAWFHVTGTVPAEAKGKKIALMIDLNGEGLIYTSDGTPIRGITNVSSEFDYSLGKPGKRIFPLLDEAAGGEAIDLWIDAGNNDLFGKYHGGRGIQKLAICTVNDKVRDLYYDMMVLDDTLGCIDNESPLYFSILYNLQKAVDCLYKLTDEELTKARAITQKLLSKRGGDSALSFNAVGHGHIDLAWLWPIRETRRKGGRTFGTQLELMKRYPTHIFGASQAQLYDWVREDYPTIYSDLKQAVADGKWEVQGGTWVEFDTNIPCGESIVRQFLYGQRYFKQEFGEICKMLWLPDVFGYSAALPQLMKKAGCDYFSTIKLSWSRVNKFPYHTFNWTGLDGTTVLAHMPPEGTYNSAALPHSIAKAGKNYQEKGCCENALLVYGIGDGGGGPGPEHLERLERLENLAGLYPVKQTSALDFFEQIAPAAETYPTYKGELYVEVHQGTLTTQANNKKYNRVLEQLLHDTELVCTLAYLQSGKDYPRETFDKIWKEVLLYQFHDIIPGSSIKRVYDESVARYKEMEEELIAVRNGALSAIATDSAPAYFNQLPWQVDAVIASDSEAKVLTIPAFGFAQEADAAAIAEQATATESTLENALVKVTFSDNGFISSFVDKSANRELIKCGEYANKMLIHFDIGDAWDFSINYRDKQSEELKLVSVQHSCGNGVATRVSVYEIGASKLTQTVTLYANSKQLKFATKVDWHETHRMLRTEFPLALNSDYINCDIQFGHIQRTMLNNTSIDYAQIEITAHKWADISENAYGVALFNDCKYGHYAKDGVISLNLLRAQTYPGENADIGEHEFNYALYPHDGNLYASDVQQRAYEFNNAPIKVSGIGAAPRIAAADKSNIIIDTIKLCEDDDSIILRLFENKGSATTASISIDPRFTKCALTDLLEYEQKQLTIENGSVTLTFHPFEVHTIKLS